jgi:hypothetical protein
MSLLPEFRFGGKEQKEHFFALEGYQPVFIGGGWARSELVVWQTKISAKIGMCAKRPVEVVRVSSLMSFGTHADEGRYFIDGVKETAALSLACFWFSFKYFILVSFA